MTLLREIQNIALVPIEAPYTFLDKVDREIKNQIDLFQGNINKTPSSKKIYLFYDSDNVKVIQCGQSEVRLYPIKEIKPDLGFGQTKEFIDAADIQSKSSIVWDYVSGKVTNLSLCYCAGTDDELGWEIQIKTDKSSILKANMRKVYYCSLAEYNKLATVELDSKLIESLKFLKNSWLMIGSGKEIDIGLQKYHIVSKQYSILYGRR